MRIHLAAAIALVLLSPLAPAGAQEEASESTSSIPETSESPDAHAAPETGSALEEIVITASGHERTRFDVLQSTAVLTGEALDRELRATLGDTLAGQPGIASTGFTAGASRPVIRGQDGPRVLGARSRDFTTFSTSLGASWAPSDQALLGVTFSRTERPPTPEELYSDGPHFASRSFEIGDPALDPEVAYGAELTARWRGARGSVGATFFYTQFEGFIFLRDTGAVQDDLAECAYSASGARFYGLELVGELQLAQWGDAVLSLVGSVDLTDAERTNGDDLPRIPPLRLRSALTLESTHVEANLGIDWAARQDEIAAFERETDDFLFLNAGVAWRPPEQVPGLSLRLEGRNLLDEKARNHVSFLKEFAPLPGRSMRTRVAVEF